MGELNGRVAVVTGAGRGIGRAIAEGLGAEGAAVCCAARTEAEIEQVAALIEARGGRAISVRTDVTDPGAVRRMFRETEQAFGGVDILVANAGGSLGRGDVADGDPELWRQTVELNLVGVYLCAREAVPYLKRRRGGKIISIGSGLGHHGVPGNSAYACAKAGLWMLTRVLAQELWQHDISVNELIPGPVITDRTQAMARQGTEVFGAESEWVKQPEDVVPLAVFLASQPRKGPTAQSYSLMRRDW